MSSVSDIDSSMPRRKADGRYEFVNTAYASEMGMPRSSLVGKTVAEVVGPAV